MSGATLPPPHGSHAPPVFSWSGKGPTLRDDTTAARGRTHLYTLEAVRADGGVAGTHVWNCVFQNRV
ncbi:hypothetical protein [Streptomyces sp. NPDC060002]|uniref:hypothetical protein n=1 Tax=Streptomyces sp. NPDC060002 TaxID=3347033 RepID=UPI0036CC92BC